MERAGAAGGRPWASVLTNLLERVLNFIVQRAKLNVFPLKANVQVGHAHLVHALLLESLKSLPNRVKNLQHVAAINP